MISIKKARFNYCDNCPVGTPRLDVLDVKDIKVGGIEVSLCKKCRELLKWHLEHDLK